MAQALLRRLQQSRPFEEATEEAAVNVLLAAAWLEGRIGQALEPLAITHRQYNVLRILRGAHPDGHPRCEITCRMIDRAPDVTRLIDRLERAGLVERCGDPQDGRLSVSRLTRAGLAMVERASEALAPVQQEVARRVGDRGARALSTYCEALYGPDVP